MKTVQIKKDIYDEILKTKPSRFDMAVNFYACVKKENEYYLVTYFNPQWNLYYPFYDDKNKSAKVKSCSTKTYGELVKETDELFNIQINKKLDLARKRFFELFKTNVKIKESIKCPISYELKESKTTNQYTIYKFYNFIITEVDDINKILISKNLTCKLFKLEELRQDQIIGNAINFCNVSKEELKQNAILI